MGLAAAAGAMGGDRQRLPAWIDGPLGAPLPELLTDTQLPLDSLRRFFADPEHLATAKNPFRISPEVAREADAALEGKDAKADAKKK